MTTDTDMLEVPLATLEEPAPLMITPLNGTHFAEVRAHFCALPRVDRVQRFGAPLSSDAISRYVAHLVRAARSQDEAVMHRAFAARNSSGKLVGVAHLAVDRDVAELGLSVNRNVRNRGAGMALMQHSVRVARAFGAYELLVLFSLDNEPMKRLAKRCGMTLLRRGADVQACLPLASRFTERNYALPTSAIQQLLRTCA